MNRLLFGFVVLSTWLCADLSPSSRSSKKIEGYTSLGVGPLEMLVPFFGVGARMQQGYFGWDLSAQVGTQFKITFCKANAVGLYIPKPDRLSQFYVGLGAGLSETFVSSVHHCLVSPQLVFGKEYTNETCDRRFFQAQIDWPFFGVGHKPLYHQPAVVLSYGLLF
jgi:hypothetical protein